ncbi:hypothetical protein L596_005840 [Steinernema carpocapsae]|uniref:Uncharacterized protein n=1 Tax=Steinernema carpocapsae TaxID=34508 RepID=A0A4U8V0J2_STECR|nr:hypothetical protein L596_005840 [Steinernema carpocapsae]
MPPVRMTLQFGNPTKLSLLGFYEVSDAKAMETLCLNSTHKPKATIIIRYNEQNGQILKRKRGTRPTRAVAAKLLTAMINLH